MEKCNYCREAPASKTCVCNQSSYCSLDCQKKDWKRHKTSCKPYTIRRSEGKGNGLFATRKIKFGEVILRDKPMMIIKNGNCDSFDSWCEHVILTVKSLQPEEADQFQRLADNGYFNKTPELLYLKGVKKFRNVAKAS